MVTALQRRTILRLIVVSPNDVSNERQLLDDVVNNINKEIASYLGLSIETFRWETDTYPGFHPAGPQGLIDELMKIENSDIVVGIFWKRFGTPTKDAGSGTEHELHKAYQAWVESNHKRPQIMVYFKEESYSPTNPEEAQQMQKVIDFRENFQKQGGLTWQFKSTLDFERLIRDHLIAYIMRNAGLLGAQSYKLLRTSDELREGNLRIVKNAEEVLFMTGSRSRDRKYLEAIEEKLRTSPKVIFYRVLFGPPHHTILRDHMLELLRIRSPKDRTYGYKTIYLSLFTDILKQYESYILGNEHEVLVILPSFSGLGEYNSAIVFTGIDEVKGLLSFVKQLYDASKPIETQQKIQALKVVKESRE